MTKLCVKDVVYKTLCVKDGVSEMVCEMVCDKVVCEMVCDKVVCERGCVEDGVWTRTDRHGFLAACITQPMPTDRK